MKEVISLLFDHIWNILSCLGYWAGEEMALGGPDSSFPASRRRA